MPPKSLEKFHHSVCKFFSLVSNMITAVDPRPGGLQNYAQIFKTINLLNLPAVNQSGLRFQSVPKSHNLNFLNINCEEFVFTEQGELPKSTPQTNESFR